MHCIVERDECRAGLCCIGDLGGPGSARRERLAVDNGRRLADRQLPETEGAAREALQVAEDCRVAGKTSEDRLLSVRARRGHLDYIHPLDVHGQGTAVSCRYTSCVVQCRRGTISATRAKP